MDTSAGDLAKLGERLDGSLVLPADPEFPRLRRAFLGRVAERVPQAVARCSSPADVAEAVAFAQAQQLPFALRSGGHSFADFSTTDGLLVDLGQLATVEIEEDSVTVGPGVRLGRLADVLANHDRVVPVGWNPSVAVGGATLGGGYGMLGRYFGLGCDHLLAAQVVLADGRVTWVDEQREPDLFWALRGAGWGSFGAITALRLRTRVAPRVSTFVHWWPWLQAVEVIDAWQRWAPAAPEEINAELVLQSATPGHEGPRVVLFGAVVGDAANARPLVEDFLAGVDFAADLGELAELSPRVAARRHTYAGVTVPDVVAPGPPAGQRPWRRAVKSQFFDRPIPWAALETLVETFEADQMPGQYRELELVPWRGAFARVAPEATAFVHRTPQFLVGHHGVALPVADESEREAVGHWVARSFATLSQAATGAVYPNYPDADLPDWAQAYYGANLPRLRRIKSHYDPADVFSFAQSVPPE
jgi:FAD/FMN-containing dehydrogenase